VEAQIVGGMRRVQSIEHFDALACCLGGGLTDWYEKVWSLGVERARTDARYVSR
jgi:hypothetical protein